LVWIAIALLAASWAADIATAQEIDERLVGYYTSWSVYDRNYHVPDIPAEQITHINYAFANLSGGEIVLGDPYADIDRFYPGDSWDPDSLRGCFHQLQLLKQSHPNLKTLISVGGWTWSTYFSDVALTPASRALFAASCVGFVQAYGFDGVDIDWEYPVSGGLPGNIYRPEDRENYTLLLAELRAQLDAAGDYLLTIAGPASPFIIGNLEVDLIHPYLDWINVMTYDFHGPWMGEGDAVTGFNAALYPAPDDPLPEPFRSTFNLDAAIQTYLELGVPAEKLHAGLAFYGRGFGNVADMNNGLYAAYSGPSGQGTWEPGVFDYTDLAANYIDQGGYTAHWHADAMVPWVYSPAAQVMISYDDSASIDAKASYILSRELGGAMFWEFCADRGGVLLQTVHDRFAGNAAVAGPAVPGLSDRPAFADVRSLPSLAVTQARIELQLHQPARVEVAIHDLLGRRARQLGGGWTDAGRSIHVWDLRDAKGVRVSSGCYFCVVRSGSNATSCIMMVTGP